jgi:hypothetical protein
MADPSFGGFQTGRGPQNGPPGDETVERRLLQPGSHVREGDLNEPFRSLIDLTEISEQDRLILSRAAEQTGSWADEFVKMFYDTLFDYPPTRTRFREGERPQREETIRKWYLQVVRGEFDDDFWQAQWHVGQQHIERQIYNSFMQGMMHRTQQFFLAKCLAAYEQGEALQIYTAFKRVTDIAAGIIAEGYHTAYAVMRVRT